MKFDPAILFEPWRRRRPDLDPYKTGKSLYDAVKSRKKALIQTSMPLADIARGDEDFAKLLAMAFERGLTVLLDNRRTTLPKRLWHPDIYVMHLDQAWRVPANAALWETAFVDGSWSAGAEAQQSLLFGYTAKQRAAWLAWNRDRQAAWTCRTIYTLLPRARRETVVAVGKRCFGSAKELAGTEFFFDIMDGQIRKNATKLIPRGTTLARVGLDWKTAKLLFGDLSKRPRRQLIEATISANLAQKVNAGLRSNVQFLNARGWS